MNMKIGTIIIFVGIISVIIFNNRNYQQQKKKNLKRRAIQREKNKITKSSNK